MRQKTKTEIVLFFFKENLIDKPDLNKYTDLVF